MSRRYLPWGPVSVGADPRLHIRKQYVDRVTQLSIKIRDSRLQGPLSWRSCGVISDKCFKLKQEDSGALNMEGVVVVSKDSGLGFGKGECRSAGLGVGPEGAEVALLLDIKVR